MQNLKVNIIGALLPFSFIGGVTNNLFEIAPLAFLLIFGIWKKRLFYYYASILFILFSIILVIENFNLGMLQILGRTFFYIFTYIVFVLYSYNLKRFQLERIFLISSSVMLTSIVLARLSPDYQSFFYLLSRSYGDAEAVLTYSGGVSGLASEPSYAAGFLGTILIGTLALRKRNWKSKNYSTLATLYFTVSGIFLTGSITGILSLFVISLLFTNANKKILIILFIMVFTYLLSDEVFLDSNLRVLQRVNEVFLEVRKDISIILFETTLTARNSVFLEFYNYPFSGGRLFGGERDIVTSGNFMIESIHIIFSPLDYIMFLFLLVGYFRKNKRPMVLLVGLQILVIQPVMLCFGLLAFRNVIHTDNKHN